jgi:hypothetical protein
MVIEVQFVSPDSVVMRSLFIELARFLTPLSTRGQTRRTIASDKCTLRDRLMLRPRICSTSSSARYCLPKCFSTSLTIGPTVATAAFSRSRVTPNFCDP